MPTERQKMTAGELYDPGDAELVAARLHARNLLHAFNRSAPDETDTRRDICKRFFGSGGDTVSIEPAFFCDYGFNTLLGDTVYFNTGCVILDVCPVRIGAFTKCGPGVHIYTASHPLDAAARRGDESGEPVTIGRDVWLGGGAIVCPGVTIGDEAVIGAGSVVTRDIPPGVIAVGNPARVLRAIEP